MTMTKRLSAPTRPSQNSPNIKKRSGNKCCKRDFWLGLCILFHGQEFMWSVRFGALQRFFGKSQMEKKKKKNNLSVLCVTVNPDLKALQDLIEHFSLFCYLCQEQMNSVIRSVSCVKASQVPEMQLKSKSYKTDATFLRLNLKVLKLLTNFI